MHLVTRLPPFVLSLTLVGCAADTGAGAGTCEAAAAHVRECFGTDLQECNESGAAHILDRSCDELLAEGMAQKADGSCPGFLSFLCAPDVADECPEATALGDYQHLTNAQKLEYHWAWGKCTEYGSGSNPPLERSRWDLIVNTARGLWSSALRLGRAFTNDTDELDEGRVKLLHPYGTLVQVDFVPATAHERSSCGETKFTGIWSEHDVHGLARLSWAANPDRTGYIPGIALKFFVEGASSVNLHAIHSLAGDPDAPNFFSKELTNDLGEPDTRLVRLLLKYFRHFADDPTHLKIEHLARVHSDGTRVANDRMVAPYQVFFRPTEEAKALYERELAHDPGIDFREALATFPVGTPLYRVALTAEPGACEEVVGTLVTASPFRASQWGDARLQFQHATEGQGFD